MSGHAPVGGSRWHMGQAIQPYWFLLTTSFEQPSHFLIAIHAIAGQTIGAVSDSWATTL